MEQTDPPAKVGSNDQLGLVEAPRHSFCRHGQPMCAVCATSAAVGEEYVREWADYWRKRAIGAEARSFAPIVAAVNKAMQEALTAAGDQSQPTAGSSREWDNGYVTGIKACAAIVQAAMFRAA